MSDQAPDQILQLENARLSYPHIWEAKAAMGSDKEKFSASFILDKKRDAAQILAFKKLMMAMAEAKFPGKAKEMIKTGKIKLCLHDGAEKEGTAGYDGTVVYINTSSDDRPTVVDFDMEPLAKSDGRPYAGCYVNAAIRLWVQDNNFGKRINAELKSIQFANNGPRLGGSTPVDPKQVFKPLPPPTTPAPEDEEIGDEDTSGRDEEDDEIPF